MSIVVKVDSFKQNIADPLKSVVDRALIRAINRTVISTRTFLQRGISDRTGIKRKDVIPKLFVNRASYGNPSAAISYLGKGLPLFAFGAKRVKVTTPRGKRYGVSALIKGQRQFIEGAFLATMKSGKTGVWQRKGDSRLPIFQLFSNEVSDLIRGDSGFLSGVKNFAQETFDKIIS